MIHPETGTKKALPGVSENAGMPDEFEAQCIREMAAINFARARWVLAIVLAVETVMIVFGTIIHLSRIYLAMYVIMALMSLIVCLIGLKFKRNGKLEKFNSFLVFFFVFSLGWSAAIGVMDKLAYDGEVTAYMAMIFLASTLFIVRTGIFIAAQAFVLIVFSAALVFFKIEALSVMGLFINILICVIISTAASRSIYKASINTIAGRMVINAKNRELEVMVARLREISTTDELTGVHNRRKFNEIIKTEWRRAIRDGCHISLIIFDIDFFKKYNDTYGHLKGDECLSAIGGMLLKKFRRANEFACRYGGEEFTIVIACNGEKQDILHICERLLEGIAELDIPHSASSVAPRVTVSAGLVTVVPVAGDSLEDFMQKADKALYAAKENGRNGFAVAPEPCCPGN